MAFPPGLEPGTCGLEIRCSIQLSYGNADNGPARTDSQSPLLLIMQWSCALARANLLMFCSGLCTGRRPYRLEAVAWRKAMALGYPQAESGAFQARRMGMAQKRHTGWERKRVRLIQNKLLKRASQKQAEKKA